MEKMHFQVSNFIFFWTATKITRQSKFPELRYYYNTPIELYTVDFCKVV